MTADRTDIRPGTLPREADDAAADDLSARDPFAGPLRDAQGRELTYLRLSLTDRCNYHCGYCSVANRGAGAALLDAGELTRLVSVFARLGVRRVRLTGGEPLVRKDIVAIAHGIRAVAGIDQLAMTTNGHRLPELAAALLEAGISRLNVSLDSLIPKRFEKLTGGAGDLARVLAGIEACRAAGFTGLKTNTVVIAGVNDDEVRSIIRWAWARRLVPRFIECMPFADGRPVPTAALIDRLRAEGLALEPADEPQRHEGPRGLPVGPSEYLRGEGGSVGFIGPLSRNFCTTCNRVRVAANGDLHPCLGGEKSVPLAPLLRGGSAADEEIARAIRDALLRKPDGHAMTAPDARAKLGPMMGIGG